MFKRGLSFPIAMLSFVVATTAPLRDGVAVQTNALQTAPTPIKTTFIEAAKLSKAEVAQVAQLAKQCGLQDVAEIETFHYLPSIQRGIRVKSAERTVGRSISYDTVYVNRIDWDDGQPDSKAKRLGAFWVREPYLSTTLLRQFVIHQKLVRIAVGKNLDDAFVDRIIPQIAAKKVRFEDDWCRSQFERLDMSGAESVYRNGVTQEYELFFGRPEMRALKFRVEGDAIVITGVAHINI